MKLLFRVLKKRIGFGMMVAPLHRNFLSTSFHADHQPWFDVKTKISWIPLLSKLKLHIRWSPKLFHCPFSLVSSPFSLQKVVLEQTRWRLEPSSPNQMLMETSKGQESMWSRNYERLEKDNNGAERIWLNLRLQFIYQLHSVAILLRTPAPSMTSVINTQLNLHVSDNVTKN